MKLNINKINEKKRQLEKHPLLITNVIQSHSDLRVFMEHHVYAVWDFMCLAKSLQKHIAPSNDVWLPSKQNRSENARLINEIILAEESDIDLSEGHISHFDLYVQSMVEVGANTEHVLEFISHVELHGISSALRSQRYPQSSIDFVNKTFQYINSNKPHVVAAAFAFGRETVIPSMFKGILQQLNINHISAPRFHYYLQRHIQIDGEEHGPAAYSLVESLCENDPIKIIEAENAAIDAIDSRIKLWDCLEQKLSE